jgi:hypothetical protein
LELCHEVTMTIGRFIIYGNILNHGFETGPLEIYLEIVRLP